MNVAVYKVQIVDTNYIIFTLTAATNTQSVSNKSEQKMLSVRRSCASILNQASTDYLQLNDKHKHAQLLKNIT